MRFCRVSKKKLAAAVRKERREHPWTTLAQARKIARDHLCGGKFGGRLHSPAAHALTIPYAIALEKIGRAGIGRPTTRAKKEYFLRHGLIRPVRNTTGFEVTAKGWAWLDETNR